jgi:hypothetical protein
MSHPWAACFTVQKGLTKRFHGGYVDFVAYIVLWLSFKYAMLSWDLYLTATWMDGPDLKIIKKYFNVTYIYGSAVSYYIFTKSVDGTAPCIMSQNDSS